MYVNGSTLTISASTPLPVLTTSKGPGVEAHLDQEKGSTVRLLTNDVRDFLFTRFSSGVTHRELVSIARIVCVETKLHLDRAAARDDRVLLIWFAEHWDQALPVLCRISLLDEEKTVIDLSRELRFVKGIRKNR